MTREFIDNNMVRLLADAFSEQPYSVARRTCKMCGKPSLRAKCDPCFRAYRVERNRIGRDRKKVAHA